MDIGEIFKNVDWGQITDTFNVITALSAITAGAILGLFAFVPLIRILVPDSPPPTSPKNGFWAAYIVIAIVLSVIVVTYYAEQIFGEALDLILRPDHLPPLWPRAVGRMFAFLVFVQAFALGVGTAIYRDTKKKQRENVDGTGSSPSNISRGDRPDRRDSE